LFKTPVCAPQLISLQIAGKYAMQANGWPFAAYLRDLLSTNLSADVPA
jgi:hypothetical protein